MGARMVQTRRSIFATKVLHISNVAQSDCCRSIENVSHMHVWLLSAGLCIYLNQNKYIVSRMHSLKKLIIHIWLDCRIQLTTVDTVLLSKYGDMMRNSDCLHDI